MTDIEIKRHDVDPVNGFKYPPDDVGVVDEPGTAAHGGRDEGARPQHGPGVGQQVLELLFGFDFFQLFNH